MDGINDYLKTPSVAFDKIVLDIAPRAAPSKIYLDARSGHATGYLQRTGGATDNWGASISAVQVDGQSKTNGLDVIPQNARSTVSVFFSAVGTDDVNIFSNVSATAGTFVEGDIFNIRFYNGTALVIHYDMSTGTVYDQSGNGNHATLFGGTWVEQPLQSSYVTFDGVDDRIIVPAFVATEFSMELKPRPMAWEQYINFTGSAVNRNGSNQDQFAAGYSAVYVDGVQAATNTAFMKLDTKQTLRGVLSAPSSGTTGTNVFWNGGAAYMEGEFYSLKIYNGTELMVHYDTALGNLSAGKLYDLTGNSRHATLTGGTWVVPATGGAVALAGTSTTSSSASTPVLRKANRLSGGTSTTSSSASTPVLRKIRPLTAVASVTTSSAGSTILRKLNKLTPSASTTSTSASGTIRRTVRFSGTSSTTTSAGGAILSTGRAPVTLAGISTTITTASTPLLRKSSRLSGGTSATLSGAGGSVLSTGRAPVVLAGVSTTLSSASTPVLRKTFRLGSGTSVTITSASGTIRRTVRFSGTSSTGTTASQPFLSTGRSPVMLSGISATSSSTVPVVLRKYTPLQANPSITITSGTHVPPFRKVSGLSGLSITTTSGSGAMKRARGLGGTASAQSGASGRLSAKLSFKGTSVTTSSGVGVVILGAAVTQRLRMRGLYITRIKMRGEM
jgi:hypothetical protein